MENFDVGNLRDFSMCLNVNVDISSRHLAEKARIAFPALEVEREEGNKNSREKTDVNVDDDDGEERGNPHGHLENAFA